MTVFRIEPNIPDPDGFYAALVGVNERLSPEQSQTVVLRLIFLLANQIGDRATLEACVREAARAVEKGRDHG